MGGVDSKCLILLFFCRSLGCREERKGRHFECEGLKKRKEVLFRGGGGRLKKSVGVYVISA